MKINKKNAVLILILFFTFFVSTIGTDNSDVKVFINSFAVQAAPILRITDISALNLNCSPGLTISKTLTVEGYFLTQGATLTLTGTDASQFSLSDYSLPLFTDSVRNTTIIINYSPTLVGTHTATLSILSSSPEATVLRTLNGNTFLNGLLHATDNIKISRNGNQIFFSATAYEGVELYNSLGKCIVRKLAQEGINSIEIPVQGMYILKVNEKKVKFVI